MEMSGIPFGTTDWSSVEPTEHPGERGKAIWRTREFGGIRVRMVEYTPGYLADHWCQKGHVLLCLEGELQTELKDGRKVTLKPGTSHIYSKRTFYIDEDSWAILATDKYDGRGELWRFAEQHNENWYNVPMFFGTLEVHNDLQSGRYIAMGLRSEEKTIYEPLKRSAGDYTPSNLRGVGTR